MPTGKDQALLRRKELSQSVAISVPASDCFCEAPCRKDTGDPRCPKWTRISPGNLTADCSARYTYGPLVLAISRKSYPTRSEPRPCRYQKRIAFDLISSTDSLFCLFFRYSLAVRNYGTKTIGARAGFFCISSLSDNFLGTATTRASGDLSNGISDATWYDRPSKVLQCPDDYETQVATMQSQGEALPSVRMPPTISGDGVSPAAEGGPRGSHRATRAPVAQPKLVAHFFFRSRPCSGGSNAHTGIHILPGKRYCSRTSVRLIHRCMECDPLRTSFGCATTLRAIRWRVLCGPPSLRGKHVA